MSKEQVCIAVSSNCRVVQIPGLSQTGWPGVQHRLKSQTAKKEAIPADFCLVGVLLTDSSVTSLLVPAMSAVNVCFYIHNYCHLIFQKPSLINALYKRTSVKIVEFFLECKGITSSLKRARDKCGSPF